MRRYLALFAAACTAAPAGAQTAGGLTIELRTPAGTPAGAVVFIAGNFNGWNPGDAAYRLVPRGGGLHTITLPADVRGRIEFKFTLGSWDRVEVDASGGDIANRVFVVPATGAATWTGAVSAWREGPPPPRPRTVRPSVAVLADSMAMPQLGRTRRVWIYLPPDYATSGRRYPVLYLHDGQNVFDDATSFAGEWGVDETLDSLHAGGDAGLIVVAVANGGGERLNEYLPWPATLGGRTVGGGDAPRYAAFIAETLKPWVDAHYRTRPDRLSTGIGGSSAGGHISFYAALRYPDVFGRVLAFSPSFFLNPELFALARGYRPRRPATRFYFSSGLEEGASGLGLPDRVFARAQRAMVDTLAAAGVDTVADVRSLLPADGAHAEWFWRREFPAAYRWLFPTP